MWLHLVDAAWFSYLYFLLLAGSVATGYFVARKRYVQKGRKWSPSGIESAVVGFYALVISFTLSAAYNASRERNALVHAQGDAIAQLHREAFFLPDPLQSEVRSFLVRHIETQLAYYRHGVPGPDSAVHLITIQHETFLQNILRDSVRSKSFATIKPAFSALSSASFKMLYSFEERTPMSVILLLLCASLLIGLLAGFMNGFHQSLHVLVPVVYTVLTFFTLKAILDLNNPLSGNTRPEYLNLVDLQNVLLQEIKTR